MKARQTKVLKDYSKRSSPFLEVHIGSRTLIQPAEIIFIEADINYSIIFLTNGRSLMVSTNIKKLEERFATHHYMVRVHRSYIINIHHLLKVNDSEAFLFNDLVCTISRRMHKNLIDLIPKRLIVEKPFINFN
jgi:DNA-binding LytR/AlgR family response regulator